MKIQFEVKRLITEMIGKVEKEVNKNVGSKSKL